MVTIDHETGMQFYDSDPHEMFDNIEKQAQKRILEKAIEKLEGKKRCTAKPYGPGTALGRNPCIACGEASESGDCVNAVIEEAIKELKSLVGEIEA